MTIIPKNLSSACFVMCALLVACGEDVSQKSALPNQNQTEIVTASASHKKHDTHKNHTDKDYAKYDKSFAKAYQQHKNDLQLKGGGRVKKILPDDNKGSRHQRFILTLANGQTLLVAHNIDLAPKIKHLKKGDVVGFYGEYEWTKQGGVIHWTHHDPAGRHQDGWLLHQGKKYD